MKQRRHIINLSSIFSAGTKKTYPIPLFDSLWWNKKTFLISLFHSLWWNLTWYVLQARTRSPHFERQPCSIHARKVCKLRMVIVLYCIPFPYRKRALMKSFPLPERQPCTKHLGMEYAKAVYLSAYMYSTPQL